MITVHIEIVPDENLSQEEFAALMERAEKEGIDPEVLVRRFILKGLRTEEAEKKEDAA